MEEAETDPEPAEDSGDRQTCSATNSDRGENFYGVTF